MTSEPLFLVGGCGGSFAAPSRREVVVQGRLPEQFPQREFRRVEFGGGTTSFLFRRGDTFIVIDQGGGIETVARAVFSLAKFPCVVHCLQTHFHADHVEGLVRNRLVYHPDVTLRFYSPALSTGDGATTSMRQIVQSTFSKPNWPLDFTQLPATIEYTSFEPGAQLEVGEVTVRTLPLNHPGGCVGYRFDSERGGAVVVATDYEPAEHGRDAYIDFIDGAGLLIADMQFCDAEFNGQEPLDGLKTPRCGWGHGSPDTILPLIFSANRPPSVVRVSHHDPHRDDAGLRAYEARAAKRVTKETSAIDFRFARDGDLIWLPR